MPTVLLAVVRPPWRTGLVCSTTFGNKQTEKSPSIRPEDIGHCSMLKPAPCVRWDAYLHKTFVYNTCVRIFVENKQCSSVSRTRAIIFELCYTSDWRVMLCLFHTKCHVGICVLGVHSLLALSLSRRPCFPAAETLLPCARNVHDPTSIPKKHKNEQVHKSKEYMIDNGAHGLTHDDLVKRVRTMHGVYLTKQVSPCQ